VFAFTVHPADITVSAGLQSAWTYLRGSWQRWLPVVAVVAVGQMLVSIVSVNTVSQMFYTDPYSDRLTVNPDWGGQVGNLILAYFGLLILGLVASWIFNALAISGLRSRPLTMSWVVERGLLSLLNGLLLGVCAFVAVIVAIIVLAIAGRALGGAAILLWIAALVGFVYVAARLAFTGLSIFDGRGPIEAISESWSLSEKSVLRLVGWGLLAALVSIAFTIVATLVSAPFSSSGSRAIGTLLSGLITVTSSCLLVFFLAVLYESQRARRDINRGGQPAYAAPYGGYGPGQYPAAPGAYPPAAPYGAYPPAPGQYPPAPYGAPAPGQWPPAPPVPGQYPAAPTPWPPAPPAGAYPPAPAVWQSAPPSMAPGAYPPAPSSTAPGSIPDAGTEIPPTSTDQPGEPGPGSVA
jgi:hypothetical protein